MIRAVLTAFALLFATAAQAEWREATSKNFIVYSEASEAELRRFAEKLEKFDYVLRRVHSITEPPSPNRLRVFLLPTIGAVEDMAGGDGIAGYYITDARGVMMVGTRENASRSLLDSESILLHEYTHHFMYHYFPATYPTWYSEGFAEFWGATKFLDDGAVEVGHPAEHRFQSINPDVGSQNIARWLTVDRLLTAQSYADVPDIDLLYAEGWLLVRYTWENEERRRQLHEYLRLINEGVSYRDAMERSFGAGARKLNSELYGYAGRGRFDVVRLPFREIDTGKIDLRTLDPAEQALIEYEVKLSQGVPNEDFEAFAADLRRTAASFPDSPFALRLLAEVERIADDATAAEAAVDRLLALDPDNARGLMYKGLLRVDALRAAETADADAWNEARQPILRANAEKPEDPLIYEAYYDSFVAQGVLPPPEAQNALYTAVELAPSDSDLRYKLALDFEHRDMIPEAIAIIRPDAYRVRHRDDESERERVRRQRREDRYRRAGTERRETAREMYDRLVEKLEGEAGAGTAAAD